MTTSEANAKKSTKIDVAPERLRTIAHQEMMLAGFSAEVRKPIWDGTYDLEHLQATYETAVGLGRDAAASAIAALAAWARVYPEGGGSEKRLTGGVELYVLDEGAVINDPTGAPFPVVGTKEAREVVDYFVSYAIDADAEQGATTTRADYPEAERLVGLLAHRDHLHAQVRDVQHAATRFQLSARTWQAKCVGVEDRAAGAPRTSSGLVEGDPLRLAWEEGWDLADRFAEHAPRKS